MSAVAILEINMAVGGIGRYIFFWRNRWIKVGR